MTEHGGHAAGQAEDLEGVRRYLLGLQDSICAALVAADGDAEFAQEEIAGARGGLARPRVLSDGAVFERAAVNFSHTTGVALPPAATQRRPELAGRSYAAASVSMIVHPRNPYAPTMHANLRLFRAAANGDGTGSVWWFGGGFDLTPYYPFHEDAVAWHRAAERACAVLGPEIYADYKARCDGYFFLPHRSETRGVGGIFFDDVAEPDFPTCFAFVRAVGDCLMPTYLPIVAMRNAMSYGDRERQWQLYRRGRYVEFNLMYDRGTLFGLQSGGRVESILASMPPLARWVYDHQPEVGSPEHALHDYLRPRDWLAEDAGVPSAP